MDDTTQSFLILGTDTDAGKTTFALLWLAAFDEQYDYWKPLETGDSDSQRVSALVPHVHVHPPAHSFRIPIAPPRAAQLEGKSIPLAHELMKSRPHNERPLVIETFGSPFSPLNDTELQWQWVRMFEMPTVLVASSALGAIGRTLQTLEALAARSIRPSAVVLMGPQDDYALAEIRKHSGATVVSLQMLDDAPWTPESVRQASASQRDVLDQVLRTLNEVRPVPSEHDRPSPHVLGGRGDGGEGGRHPTSNTVEAPGGIPANQPPLTPVPSPSADVDQAASLRSQAEGEGRSRSHASGDWIARDRRAVWHPYTSLGSSVDPLVCVGADREFLHLADGRRVVDAISSWWTILFGHRDPVLLDAWSEATRTIDHVLFAGVTHPWGIELAERLLARTFPDGRVFYSDNGSTAVEVALKMAYQFWCHHGEPGRTRFVGFEHGYHGDTFGAMSVSRDPVFFGRFEPLLFRADILPLEANRLDEHLKVHASETAGILVEPLVQGAGGMRMHSPATLADLAECCRRHKILFLADEVMTGCGRTGTFWAHESAGVQPDIVCSAKTLAGGLLPLAATLAAPDVVRAFETSDTTRTFFHGHSFTAHPLACAVALANLRRFEGTFPAGPARIEAFWQQQRSRFESHPAVGEIRARGSIFALALRGEAGYLAEVGRRIARLCLERGVFLRPLGNVVYVLPPYDITDDSLARIADAIAAAITESHQDV